MSDLSKEDWQYVAYVMQEAFNKGKSKPGEPPTSKEFKQQENRIMTFILNKAYSSIK